MKPSASPRPDNSVNAATSKIACMMRDHEHRRVSTGCPREGLLFQLFQLFQREKHTVFIHSLNPLATKTPAGFPKGIFYLVDVERRTAQLRSPRPRLRCPA